ncbi:MAG TPA: hypothetical protein VG965_01345 [Patescibacteria group bacterium]|nr:hypothetical protein [Patescibacteria group bacterium]
MNNTNVTQDPTQQQDVNMTVQSVSGDFEIINGVACPIDPQERLQCESCQ